MSVIATKLQVGTAAVAVAAAAAITPAVAHAAPSLASFTEGVGNSAELLVDPVVIVAQPAAAATPGSNKVAAAAATPPAQVIQIFISGFVDAAQSAIQAGVQYFGTFVYGGLAFTGLAFNLAGQILPGPIGDAFTNIGNGFDNAATNVAKAIKIGPYSTSS
ncbi:TRAP-type mannitol/chloroaromatic compound transport system substrate-binding protein [Mycolicibacterium sp. BK556]|uniref:hypothetical protein n=1 Tax=Mycobacteriaceae TaxID=1762 RepID=UPI00105D54D2|nr:MULTISPECIES: hypothetical protein [Mycobacteriaceae]MBB3607024.1 TRAP-type mannitol/chloroaromatic compound transport system substrate-binding protein [Mycolicibacterium sp. BK556]MBB3636763.1 TRAP-type mannitol/chloroaromatic compound transport system substrate-binding protein [Mycolicibacterium sp. BK607]MBB3747564.1 TRAP-type mannitol/chloroaromatic compound transport system substrate-binding protein [Mycolicibacterium sp. BK634]TDO08298.1 hypothetical protein EV580_5873 [Mycobacterium s